MSTGVSDGFMTTDRPAGHRTAVLTCGARFEAPTGGVLTLTGSFPGAVASHEQMVTGTVMVAAGQSRAHGVITPQADAFLVRDGRLVTLPVPQDSVGQPLDLTFGRVEQVHAVATLVPCAGDGVLPSGSHDLYVRVVLNLDDGSQEDCFGGPWPLEVH